MHGNFKRCQLKYFSKAKKKIRKTKVLKQNLIYTANKALAGETNSEGQMFGFLYFHRGLFSFHGCAVIMRSPGQKHAIIFFWYSLQYEYSIDLSSFVLFPDPPACGNNVRTAQVGAMPTHKHLGHSRDMKD